MATNEKYISKNSVSKAVENKYPEATLISYNIVHKVVRATFIQNNKKYSRFISKKDVAKAAIELRVKSSKELKMKPFGTCGHKILDSDNMIKHSCNYQDCTCQDYWNNDLESILGIKVCKHTIASAKADRIANSLNQLINVIKRQENNCKAS